MKVAIATDDGSSVSQHFGRSKYYVVYQIEDGKIMGSETRPKASHTTRAEHHSLETGPEPSHEHGIEEGSFHEQVLSNVRDCQAIVTRGMGRGIHSAIEELGMLPIVTLEPSVEGAIQTYLKGTLTDHPERLH